MKVSLNIIKQYLDFGLPPVDELVARINSQLGGVEAVVNLGKKYKDAVVVKVVECEKHPDADRLSICKIDDNSVVHDVERDKSGFVQVVCGAPNVRTGMLAVWLPPGSTVPASHDGKEPFVLGARELRGVLSQGMLAAGDELAISSDHDGIIEITTSDLPNRQGSTLQGGQGSTLADLVGAGFAEVFGLDDTIIDIENKMFTHRPDCFGQLGIAREIAGIFGYKFKSPKWYTDTPEFDDVDDLKLEVFNAIPDKVSRFMAVVMKDVEVRSSPLWLQCALVAMGAKPINNIVDVTNYVMFLTAQPTHAYDYDKLRDHKLGVRLAKNGEKSTLLNGKIYEFTEEDVVIADGEGVVGLAGIMGGFDSEVTSETKNIVLECANFDMYAVRKSSMRHGLFTDALTRFNKGQSPLQNPHILNLLMMSIKDVSPSALQVSDVFDKRDKINEPKPIEISSEFINERLGCKLTETEITKLLDNVEIKIEQGDRLRVLGPFWRTDIEILEDIVEEVGRLYGFDKLPTQLPRRSIKPAVYNPLLMTKQKIRETLARAGANEVLTYSFVHGDLFDKVGQDKSKAYKLSNALSPDLEYYRLSLTPSLLDKVHANIKAGFDEFALFELGKGHNLIHKSDEDDVVPPEFNFLDLVYASNGNNKFGAAFYRARRLLDEVARAFGCEFEYKPVDKSPEVPVADAYDIARSAYVSIRPTGDFLGMIGEFKASVRRSLKLPAHSAGFSIDPEVLMNLPSELQSGTYRSLSRYPATTQDLCFKIFSDIKFTELEVTIKDELAQNEFTWQLQPIDIYTKDGESTKNITFRLTLTHKDRTLTNAEVNTLVQQIADVINSKLKGQLV